VPSRNHGGNNVNPFDQPPAKGIDDDEIDAEGIGDEEIDDNEIDNEEFEAEMNVAQDRLAYDDERDGKRDDERDNERDGECDSERDGECTDPKGIL